jgi:hypothetical protein
LGRFLRLRFGLARVGIVAIPARVLVAATLRGRGTIEGRATMDQTTTTITYGAAGQA